MSEVAKHTPGPWEIGTETRGYEVCTIHQVTRQPTEDGLGQSWVYIHAPRVIDGDWHWPDGEEQIANARVIAAAPDLLEALKASELGVEELCTGQHPDNECWNTLRTIRAAIAEAEGRQP
ncbi:hypothetical protein GCM10011491_30400 [Brucella endophytica]|uniref:Uncharacterized protein n=1 Tax=Brucella endophytica TaxID=1963359 RepID=A0A916SJ36_9HYPH|nr:hypothetical protein [Brucella endophytica]GGB00071.1 hypothetical protein GCM10011491_30400 [Brucella endophytica]